MFILAQPRLVARVANGYRILIMVLVFDGNRRPRILAAKCITNKALDRCVQCALFQTFATSKTVLVELLVVKRGRIATRRTKQIELVVELKQTTRHVELDALCVRAQLVLHCLTSRFPIFFDTSLAMLFQFTTV